MSSSPCFSDGGSTNLEEQQWAEATLDQQWMQILSEEWPPVQSHSQTQLILIVMSTSHLVRTIESILFRSYNNLIK